MAICIDAVNNVIHYGLLIDTISSGNYVFLRFSCSAVIFALYIIVFIFAIKCHYCSIILSW